MTAPQSGPGRSAPRRLRERLERVFDAARAKEAALDPEFERSLSQAIATSSIARRGLPWELAEPSAAWLAGARLYRTAAVLALEALGDREVEALEVGLARLAPAEAASVASAAGASSLDTGLFAEPGALEPPSQQRLHVRRMRRATERLVQLARRRRTQHRWLLRAHAWRRPITAAAVTLLVAAATVPLLAGHPFSEDIAAGRPWVASSALADHGALAGKIPENRKRPHFFHTEEQDSPWLEIELARGSTVSGASIENRNDCCPWRAVPLVVEVSGDRSSWKEVARCTHTFDRCTVEFARQPARFLRLRVARKSILHLAAVRVFR